MSWRANLTACPHPQARCGRRAAAPLRMRPAVALGQHGREFRISIIAQDLHAMFERHNEAIHNFGFGEVLHEKTALETKDSSDNNGIAMRGLCVALTQARGIPAFGERG